MIYDCFAWLYDGLDFFRDIVSFFLNIINENWSRWVLKIAAGIIKMLYCNCYCTKKLKRIKIDPSRITYIVYVGEKKNGFLSHRNHKNI